MMRAKVLDELAPRQGGHEGVVATGEKSCMARIASGILSLEYDDRKRQLGNL
jgi:hypothetical protein